VAGNAGNASAAGAASQPSGRVVAGVQTATAAGSAPSPFPSVTFIWPPSAGGQGVTGLATGVLALAVIAAATVEVAVTADGEDDLVGVAGASTAVTGVATGTQGIQ
jgi:hypothetical protein